MKAGLARTRAQLGLGLGALVARGRVDEGIFVQIEEALLGADCGVRATQQILDSLRQRAVRAQAQDSTALRGLLREILLERLAPLERVFDADRARPYVVMFAGVNGSGKTTSIGKLAKWLQDQGRSVLLAAGDTFRAAAREQLLAWGRRNGVEVVSQASGDSAAVIFDALSAARARGIDVLIADTAGRLPTQLHLMDEIAKVKRVLAKAMPEAPHEILLVLDAGTGQNALAQIDAFDRALGLTGLILTKLDGTAKGGILCAIAARQQPLPVYFLGVGEAIEDLRPFSAREFVEALID